MSAKQSIDELANLSSYMQIELEKLRSPECCKTIEQEVAVDKCQVDVTALQEGPFHELREVFSSS